MVYENLSDQELWQLCRQDDIKAYNALFMRYAPKLYKHAYPRYVKNSMDAEEVVMDLLYNLWKKREDLPISGDVRAYLYRSLHNRLLNHIRKHVLKTSPIELVGEDAIIDNRHADYGLLSKSLEQQYLQKLEELSPQRRKVFLLSREENLSYSQIAQKMNLSVSTVESHMVAALQFLRESTREMTVLSIIMLSIPGAQ